MANLLPQSFRDDITSEYKLRLATIGLLLLAVVLLAATALLAPSFILTGSRLEQKQATLDTLSAEATSTSTEQSREVITVTNEKLSIINQENQNLQPTDIIELITGSKPAAVSVRQIRITDTEDETVQEISVSGTAQTRDDLLAFESNLANRAQVQEVNLPIGTLASQENPTFSLTLTVKPL